MLSGAAIADAVRFVYGDPLLAGEQNAAEWDRLNGLASGKTPTEVVLTEEKAATTAARRRFMHTGRPTAKAR